MCTLYKFIQPSHQIPQRCLDECSYYEKEIKRAQRSLYIPKLSQKTAKEFFRPNCFLNVTAKTKFKVKAQYILSGILMRSNNLSEFIETIMNSTLLKNMTRAYKIKSLSKYITDLAVFRRDAFIKRLLFLYNSLMRHCNLISDQMKLDATTENVDVILLGPSYHSKGWDPYFPEFSFHYGTNEYPYKQASKNPTGEKHDEKNENQHFNPCDIKICKTSS